MSKVQFSWNNQKGYGLVLLFFGWSLIIQIPAFYYNFLVIKVPAASNDWLIFAGTIILTTTIIGSFAATIYENLYNPFDSTLINIHTVVLASFVVFYFFYLLTVPAINTLEPFLNLPRKIDLFGWGEYLVCIFSGLLGMAIFWYSTEYYLQYINRRSSSQN